jgi:hypothetical protein
VKTWTIFSFVAPSEVTNYNSDLKPFLSVSSYFCLYIGNPYRWAAYLTQNQGVPSSQFLVQAQAGTEPFVGELLFIASCSFPGNERTDIHSMKCRQRDAFDVVVLDVYQRLGSSVEQELFS